MAVAIKLMRIGKKGVAFYRIVAVDKRKKRNGDYIEKVGSYDPNHNPAKLEINKDRLNYWMQKGALLSEGIRKLLGSSRKIKKDSP
ncbi:30S ribosomal protein S16 [Candidatus Roizmanbacteria bacterium]|jgi:small subunit ribosomal protein S16|nr:30S ribosomal protein S16 [Candidatus Roizmanbacteria bacterium]